MPRLPAASAGIAQVFRVSCLVVVAVAGLAGAVMVVAPQATDSYFSWPIGPPPLAVLVGAFYLASAVLFALLARQDDWLRVRGVCFGILAFTLPTVGATVRHAGLFDWSRWQALAWVALFVGSPVAFGSFLYLHRGRRGQLAPMMPALARAALAVLATSYVVLALMLLLTPGWLQARSPFALPGLSGRFLGSWCAFLAVLALFAIWRDRTEEAAVPLLALVAWPVAAVLAAVRSFGGLQPPSRRVGYLAMLVTLAALAAVARMTFARPAASVEEASPRREPAEGEGRAEAG